jgi:copper homeostasis protein
MFTFEVCAANIQSALAAQATGGHRIELCSALDAGGVTPSNGLIKAAVEALTIPVCVLIRPREGDFCFNEDEVAIMVQDIQTCRQLGAAGVVVGALTPNRQLDLDVMHKLKEAARDMEFVCHRAFDFALDQFEALEQLMAMGCRRVLTSGGAPTAWEGRERLRELVSVANSRIEIMPGAGISAKNIGDIVRTTGATQYHFTGRKRYEAPVEHIVPGLDAAYWVSDEDTLRAIMQAATQ